MYDKFIHYVIMLMGTKATPCVCQAIALPLSYTPSPHKYSYLKHADRIVDRRKKTLQNSFQDSMTIGLFFPF
jgi:hypothetical protein